MDYGHIPKGSRFKYFCLRCGNVREGRLDHPGYDWRCGCGGETAVEDVTKRLDTNDPGPRLSARSHPPLGPGEIR